jgi:hypothetical protein
MSGPTTVDERWTFFCTYINFIIYMEAVAIKFSKLVLAMSFRVFASYATVEAAKRSQTGLLYEISISIKKI